MSKKAEQGSFELPGMEPEKVFTVAEFIEVLNVFFKKERVRLVGEVSELKRAPSGHVYFSIKDKDTPGVMSCIIWNRNYDLCGIDLTAGMEIVLSGYPNIYPNSGKLSFVADTIELVGEGALKKAYEALKRKLTEEGIFSAERKRPIPEFVHKIGVITSREGAVIHDFVNNLGKFGFEVDLVDARVEGQQAVKSLIDAVHTLAKRDIEVLVVIRGGGSLESLQAFNNEALIREIVQFPVPVIAGIGHDQDVPLLALAADHLTSTPTAAAHLLSRSWEEAYARIREFAGLLDRIPREIEKVRERFQQSWNGIAAGFEGGVKDAAQIVALAERTVRANDPHRQLRLGYAIARSGNKVVRSIAKLTAGERVEVQLSDGSFGSEITTITTNA
jgi:exodeoxyribonuclease VII large subunit